MRAPFVARPRHGRSATLHDRSPAERDACGIGFLADAEGRPSRALVDAGLEALCRVKHRGAVADDALTGDGAGMLLPVPRFVLDPHETAGRPAGIGMVFLPPKALHEGRALVAAACAREGLDLVRWRPVPVEPSALGERARAASPVIEQAIVRPVASVDEAGGERLAYAARRRIELAARAGGCDVYVPSLSFRTIVYKALCAADQLASFYADLSDSRYRAWFAIFHQRYSTNTAPSWRRAQPFRFVAHNGEINTVRGNAARMRGRSADLGDVPIDRSLLMPLLDETGSDSALLDEALELLVRSGVSLDDALAMLVPAAWEHRPDSEVRELFRHHATVMEPWDGPAALVFSDGKVVGAGLDRNGLRPLRVFVGDDGFVACASEAGAVPTARHGAILRRRLGPGQVLMVDPAGGGVRFDADVKSGLARRVSYRARNDVALTTRSSGKPLNTTGSDLVNRQVASGYSKEEFTVVIRPMATEGKEPTSSMGDDTALPGLARPPRLAFGHLKQRFAQVTNPPIDHLRERHVMSLRTLLGARPPLLGARRVADPLFEYETFLLFPSEVDFLGEKGAATLDATFDSSGGPAGLEAACRRLADEAGALVNAGCSILIVSQRAHGAERAAVPSLFAAGAVHHRLVANGARSRVGLVVDADDVRDGHHFSCLLTNGGDSVCPRLALEAIVQLARSGRLGGNVDADEAQRRYVAAVEESVLKIMSKMGIAVLDSYRGAQIIEAVGLGDDVIDLCLPGVGSPLGGLSFAAIGAEVVERHHAGFAQKPVLVNTGSIKYRAGGEYHAFNPGVVSSLQDAAAEVEQDDRDIHAAHALRRAVVGDDTAYARFARLVNERPATQPRDLLELRRAHTPMIPMEEVEPVEAITRRFSTGAMSHGALSAEAHETLARAMNMIGGLANSGEGGEAPERFRTDRNCGIKQIASGRFGVTPDYIAFAQELQIKMAQGSKPGEGGQLPGKKVTDEIAQLRHTVPGVALISPPPHHDIYSIEDLAQLIYDLRQANPRADVSVKLVATEGVGTIASGVVKGLADVVHIAGGDGGTGASPLSSIKNAGLPWEVGLVDTHRALIESGLRSRARLRVDGGFKTGRDVVIAALLGADEYSFGTAALVAQGCILVRTCHRDTCPVGIATQNPALRAKFAGTPEMVARYLVMVAEEVRHLLASLGLHSLDEAIGRSDLLTPKAVDDTAGLDVSPLLPAAPADARRFRPGTAPQRPRSALGDRLYEDAIASLARGEPIALAYTITTADRAVGARLGSALGYELGVRRPRGRVTARFRGSAGQSFGAFLADGIELHLTGDANDYVGKGMAGGRIVITPPGDDAGKPVLAGNTLLYGATGGQLFVAGGVGERFAVRNSGAVAVVEGTGDHACEYMTAGAVVILGPTGINLGAGMSGGEAYVLDDHHDLDGRLNPQLVAAYQPTHAQLESLRRVISKHAQLTVSPKAQALLERWNDARALFKRVAPIAEVARLEALFEGTATTAA